MTGGGYGYGSREDARGQSRSGEISPCSPGETSTFNRARQLPAFITHTHTHYCDLLIPLSMPARTLLLSLTTSLQKRSAGYF